MKKILLYILMISAIATNAQDSTAFIATEGDGLTSSSIKYASIPTPFGSNLRMTGDWTIEAWVKIIIPGNGSVPQIHIVETYGSGTGGFILRLNNNKVMAYQRTNLPLIGNTTLTIGNWYHIAATLNETTDQLKVYVNGVVDGTRNTSFNTLNTNNELKIGARGDDSQVTGEVVIDEVRIWNFAKTQLQLQADTTACLTGNETDLLAWYDFEGSPSCVLTDKSTNSNDGTFINPSLLNFVDGVYSCGASSISTDITAPLADSTSLPTITGQCSVAFLTAPTAADNNCSGFVTGTHNATLPITTNTTINWTFTDKSGNFSTQTQDIEIDGVDTSVSVLTGTITSNETGATYRWLDCNNNNAVIIGETSINYTPTNSGDYAVEITDSNSCIDTSACTNITIANINNVTNNLTIKIYPNPTNNLLNIKTLDKIKEITIYNITGTLVKQIRENTNTINVSELPKGLYFLTVKSNNKITQKRFIKE